MAFDNKYENNIYPTLEDTLERLTNQVKGLTNQLKGIDEQQVIFQKQITNLETIAIKHHPLTATPKLLNILK